SVTSLRRWRSKPATPKQSYIPSLSRLLASLCCPPLYLVGWWWVGSLGSVPSHTASTITVDRVSDAAMELEDNQRLPGSDAAEKKKVASLRALVEGQNPAAKVPPPADPIFLHPYLSSCFVKIITLSCQMQEVDDLMLRRFLRARNLDVEKASALFLKYLEWRCTAVPNGFISETEIKNELSHKEIFTQGFDKLGRPIVVYHVAKHFCSNRDMDELKRKLSVLLCIFLINYVPGQEKFTCIADLNGWGYSNCDIRGYLASLDILQFIFIENKDLKATLLEDIDESQLPEIYGGKLPLVPVEESTV
ncbi:hypothetical protein GW17_00036059, partial [Ensete ventricosum]